MSRKEVLSEDVLFLKRQLLLAASEVIGADEDSSENAKKGGKK